MYRHDYSPTKTAASGATKLYDSDFYVVNSQYQCYKVIYNGTSPSDPNGKPSTVEPTGTSTSIITTGDGYRWKYMYTIPVASVLKFFSNDYMPVFTNTSVKTNAVAGEIDTVVSTLQVLVTTTELMIMLQLMETELVVVFLSL